MRMEKEVVKDYSRIHRKLSFMPSASTMPVLKILGNCRRPEENEQDIGG